MDDLALALLLPVPCHEARLCPGQVGAALAAEHFPVNAHITHPHLEALAERIAYNFALLHIHVFRERNAIRQRPGITLAGDRSQLIGHRESLLVRSDDRRKQPSGEFPPEVIQESLRLAAVS